MCAHSCFAVSIPHGVGFDSNRIPADRQIPARLQKLFVIVFIRTSRLRSPQQRSHPESRPVWRPGSPGCRSSGCSVDPLVDRLRCRETEYHLHILYGHAGCNSQPVDLPSGRDNVNEWDLHHIAPPMFRQRRFTGVPAILPYIYSESGLLYFALLP